MIFKRQLIRELEPLVKAINELLKRVEKLEFKTELKGGKNE